MADPVSASQTIDAVKGLHYANATRYISAVGLVLLLHDHVLTLPQEVSLIWKAPSSFAKYAFLVNRYLVPASLILVATGKLGAICVTLLLRLTAARVRSHGTSEMSDFNSTARSDLTMVAATAVLSVYSIGMANLLVLFRVLLLWNKHRVILRILFTAFAVSFALTFISLIYFVVRLDPGVEWSPVARMCILSGTSREYALVWLTPLTYEFLVLGLTIYNALSQPRSSNVELSHILRRDGILFFLILMSLRFINIGFALTQDSRKTFLVIYLVWALVTLVLNRFLLNVRAAEVALSPLQISPLQLSPVSAPLGPFGLDGRASPFALWVVAEEESVDDDDLWRMKSNSCVHSLYTIDLFRGSHRTDILYPLATRVPSYDGGTDRRDRDAVLFDTGPGLKQLSCLLIWVPDEPGLHYA
ncbi:hypothetical protein EVG20_g1396 [Dentipellis fragilis]|uniref:DUF6533 domain-containing protein n=1 Tax=Dentipellis fragilis TaxID=205917 RepID=A0A4Y9ZDY7_9AGAM|nr:hypothetical protein EVG20_g1396 [Dentipellis fragilis]